MKKTTSKAAKKTAATKKATTKAKPTKKPAGVTREEAMALSTKMAKADLKKSKAGPETTVQISVPPSAATLITVPIKNVVVSPLNPRKRVDPASIEEMADSIIEHDIVQPPVARPGKYADTYEVVYGQRRLLGKRRAIEKLKAEKRPPMNETIQLLLREMDDRTVIEEAWVENLQRVDVSVREEAMGFEELLKLLDDEGQPLYSVNRLALKLGKDPAFVSRRLKLKGVSEDLWKALDEELIGVRQLELVGCLPTQEMRDKAASAVLKPRFRVSPPLTVKETQVLIKEEFMVSLAGVEWDLKDADLVPVVVDEKDARIYGGACRDCDFRTGRNPDLQASLSDGTGSRGWKGNSCMLPTCFKKKKSAIWDRAKKAAVESGAKVLTDQEAKKTFSQWGGVDDLERSSGMVVLSSSPGYAETGHHAEETLPSWESMIGGKVPAAEVVIARNPKTGAIRRLLPQKLAIELAEEALKEQGKESPFEKRKKEKAPPKGPKERSELEISRAIKEKLATECFAWLRTQGREGAVFGDLAREELFVYLAKEAACVHGATSVCENLGIALPESDDAEVAENLLESKIREAVKKGECWWLLVELAVCLVGEFDPMNSYGPSPEKLSEAIGLPLDALTEDAKAQVDAEEKARLKEGKKGGKAA